MPIFVQFLTSLSAVLDKAAAFCEAKKIEPSVLLNTRLAPDMFPLGRQVRAATDHAVSACGRLAGAELPTFSNSEATIPELKERIAKTIDFLKSLKPAQIDGNEGKEIKITFPSGATREFTGQSLAAQQFAAEFLFPLHHRLRHPAPMRGRPRQARLHGHAGVDVGSGCGGDEGSTLIGTGGRPMFSMLKAAWARLAGGGSESDAPAAAVEYKGYRIRPAPYRTNSLYQTAGIIEKDFAEGVKQHRFIRADTHQSKQDAIDFAIAKAKQIIDLQGDRMFDERRT